MEYPGGLVRPTTYAKSKLKLYLMIPPAQRTPSQIDEMANLIITLEIHFLKQYQNSHKLHALCGSIYLKPLADKAVLFEQGDEGNALYCVFSGAVGIYNITKDEEGDEKQTMVAQIIPYEVIGEISILYGQKRTATAIATEDSELLVLDQEILTTILKGDDGMNHLEAHINALRGFALLQTCSDSYLKRIAAKCFTNKFRTYTVIIPQGQRPDGVYFIKSGKVKILRKIEFLTTAPLSYVENTELLRDPTRQEISDSKTEAKLIEIDELGPGEMFGELAVLSERAIAFTAVTSMPSELVLIEIKDIMGPQSEIKRRLREIVKSYPPDEYFRRIYYKNTLWNSYKKTLVNNVLVDKQARNHKGKLGLRSATPTPVKPRKNISFCHKQADLYSDKGAGVLKLPPIYNMYCMVDSKMNSGLSEDGKISTFSSFLKELTQKNQKTEPN